MSRNLNQEDEFGSKQEASFQIRSFQQNSSFDQKPNENEASRKQSHSSLFQDFLNDSQTIKTDLKKKENFENQHGGSFQQQCSVPADEQSSINQSIQINPLRVDPENDASMRQQEQQQEFRDEAINQECYHQNTDYQDQPQNYQIANPPPQAPQQSQVEAAPLHPQMILETQPKKQATQLPQLKHAPVKQNILFQEQNHNQNNNPGLQAALSQQPQPQNLIYFQQHYDYFPVAQTQVHNHPAQTNYASNGYAVHPGPEPIEDERDCTKPSQGHKKGKKHGDHSSASETDSQNNKRAKNGHTNVIYFGQAQPIGYNPGVHLAAEVSVFCCFGLLNSKDTCCHWICDLLIFFIAAPARLLVFLIRGLWNCCLEQLVAILCDGCQRDCANCGTLLTGNCSRCWASIRKGVTGECLLLCTCCASCTGDQIARKAQGCYKDWCSNCEGCLLGCWSTMVLFISGLCNKICSLITGCCRVMIALFGKCFECLSSLCKGIYEIMGQCCQILCELCSKCL